MFISARSNSTRKFWATVTSRAFHSSHITHFLPAPDLPPSPTSPEALGFAPSGDRKRSLPEDLKIELPSSAKRNINQDFTIGRKRSNDKRQRTPTNPYMEADFFEEIPELDSIQHGRRDSMSRQKRAARRAVPNISTDIVAAETDVLPPDVTRRQRQKREHRQTGQTKGQRIQRSPRMDLTRDVRQQRPGLVKSQVLVDAVDHSVEGLFGRHKLLSQDFKRVYGIGKARRPLLIHASTRETELPSTPISILSSRSADPINHAINVAQWSAALNPSIRGNAKVTLPQVASAVLGKR
ncbi:uncharacterized protein L203_103959 [Cryptococcus depauperatus CBS 7841]|uniref:Uncharacterized protein n=1 Tax=Cryptococcus depauperatus CBS 7841 TaxID=1295531 RepID=A0A1E3HSA4_9TREE|nr:hypothetical protein L203_06012 [Cryptococcus depauperatus CBS 7841]